MAFEFDPDEMFRWCALYISKGLRIVRVNGMWPDGRCTCGNPDHRIGGPGERSCGKHPVGEGWAKNYAKSEDDILEWLADGVPFNIGVILGPSGGFIDSEDDDPAGTAFRESIGIDTLDTPTWTSGKSTHQLTKWSDAAAVIKKNKVVISGLEVRLGCGDKMTQSVLPPSWHRTGVRYRWKEGFSIDDVEPAETPRALLVPLVNGLDGKQPAASSKEPARNLLFEKVKDGEGRYEKMLRWMWLKFMKTVDPLHPATSEEMLAELHDTNLQRLDPPKKRAEIVEMFSSTKEHYRRKLEGGWRPRGEDREEAAVVAEVRRLMAGESDGPPVCGLAQYGLEQYAIGTAVAYKPGDWKIEMIMSDPPEIILCVPAWENTICKGRVSLSLDEYRAAAKVASAVFIATRRVMLDANPSLWRKAWHGQEPCKKNGGVDVPGLAQLLMEKKSRADDREAGVSSLRYAVVAGWLLEALRKRTKPKEEENPEPNESGRPCEMPDGSIWLKWAKTWEDIGRLHDVQAGDRLKLKRLLCEEVGVKDLREERHTFAGVRHSYVVFTAAYQDALERLAAGRAAETKDAHIAGDGGPDFNVPSEKNGVIASI